MKKKTILIISSILVLIITTFFTLYFVGFIPKRILKLNRATVQIAPSEYAEDKDPLNLFIKNADELENFFTEVRKYYSEENMKEFNKKHKEYVEKYNQEYFFKNLLLLNTTSSSAGYDLQYPKEKLKRYYINKNNKLIIEYECIQKKPKRDSTLVPQIIFTHYYTQVYEIPKKVVEKYNLTPDDVVFKYSSKYVTEEEFEKYDANF